VQQLRGDHGERDHGYSDLGVLSSASYSYRVRGFDAAGNLGAYSNVASATTGASEQLGYIFPDHLNTPRMIADQAGLTVLEMGQHRTVRNSMPNDDPMVTACRLCST